MADISATNGMDDLMDLFEKLAELPDELIDDMLQKQADIISAEQRKNAATMLNEKGYGKGTTASSIKIKKPTADKNGGRKIVITFDGVRVRGKTKTRNAEIAFINEFGTGSIPGRQFIRLANEAKATEAAESTLDLLNKFQNTEK